MDETKKRKFYAVLEITSDHEPSAEVFAKRLNGYKMDLDVDVRYMESYSQCFTWLISTFKHIEAYDRLMKSIEELKAKDNQPAT